MVGKERQTHSSSSERLDLLVRGRDGGGLMPMMTHLLHILCKCIKKTTYFMQMYIYIPANMFFVVFFEQTLLSLFFPFSWQKTA
jgi:hypothetical protein